MKTIFITSFHGLISRNILATPVLGRLLARSDVGVILLVPEPKKLFFASEFLHPRIYISGVAESVTRSDRFSRYLAFSLVKTRSLAIKRKTELRGSGAWLAALLGGRAGAMAAARWLDRRFTPRDRFGPVLDRYRPNLVFAADVQNENDVRLMHEARDRGIPVVGMVRSWDNLAAKGMIRITPDALIVNNEIIRDEAVRYSAIPAEKIRVVGIPHYDRYLTEPRSSREEFFRRISGDPSKRLILYAPTGDRYLGENTVDREVIELIVAAMPSDCQLLVRLPPMDAVSGVPKEGKGRLIFDRPRASFLDVRNTELTAEADRHLADTLSYADLVIAGPSTMAVDAAFFNKPVILVGFDGKRERPYYESVARYFDYEHWQPVLSSGGVRLVRNAGEFQDWIQRYLADSEIDASGRRAIALAQCWRLDAASSQRLADILLSFLPT